MWEEFKKWSCYFMIIVLLPYIVTVFVHGPKSMMTARAEEIYVQVKEDEKITKVPMEAYGIGVMAKEVLPTYEKEMLKAQAILVRTEIYRKMNEKGKKAVFEQDFWKEKQMEEAWGKGKYIYYYKKLKSAWLETSGQVLMYEGELAKTPFFRLSNGITRNAKDVLGEEIPYLKSVECPQDIEHEEQIKTFTLDPITAEIKKCDAAGYVLGIQVEDQVINGEEFRTKYQLSSSCFTLQNYNGKLRITTRGIGHGLGMSQNMANVLAKEGKDFKEILNYFFEGTKVKEVIDIV